jgi:hypothetical protein
MAAGVSDCAGTAWCLRQCKVGRYLGIARYQQLRRMRQRADWRMGVGVIGRGHKERSTSQVLRLTTCCRSLGVHYAASHAVENRGAGN